MIQIPIDFDKNFKHLYRRIIPKSKYFNKNTMTIYNNDTRNFQYYISKNDLIYFDNDVTPIFQYSNLIKHKYNYNNTLNKNKQKYTYINGWNKKNPRYSSHELIKDYSQYTGTNTLTIGKLIYVCNFNLNKNFNKYLCNNIKYLNKYITKSLRFDANFKYLNDFNINKYTSSDNILLYTKNYSINPNIFFHIVPNINIEKNITLLPPPQVFVKSNQVFLIPI